jgi:hypothetical protein
MSKIIIQALGESHFEKVTRIASSNTYRNVRGLFPISLSTSLDSMNLLEDYHL